MARLITLALLALLGAVCGTPLAAETRTLVIAADEWCPINCGEHDARQGIGVEVARKIFEPLGYEVKYNVMPWARALQWAREGKIDAVIGANAEDDPTLLFPKIPLYEITDGFYVLADNPLRFDTLDSLKGQRIGTINDYGYSKSLKKFIAVHKKTPGMIQEMSGDGALEQNIRKLTAKRIDVVVESVPVMEYTLERLGMKQDIRHIGDVWQGPVYLAFSPNHPESPARLRAFDKAMAALIADGEMEKMYMRYGLEP